MDLHRGWGTAFLSPAMAAALWLLGISVKDSSAVIPADPDSVFHGNPELTDADHANHILCKDQ